MAGTFGVRKGACGALVLTAAVSLGAIESGAQNVPSAAAPQATANAPASAGEIAMKRGIDAYNAGKLANAIGSLSTAISNGGLNSSNLARSLYYRGLAYRKHGKPAQAIPDLTNAIWLAGGLTDSERNDAMANRAAAYREAGIAEPGGAAAAAAAPAAPAPAPLAATPAARSAPIAATSGWQTSTGGTAGIPAAAPSAPPVAVTSVPPASQSGGIGGFFNNLFSGFTGSGQSAPPPGEVATASTAPAAASLPTGSSSAVTAGAPSAAVSAWSNTTAVTPQRTASVSPPAATRPVAASAPQVTKAAAGAAGGYKLQVAVVRSRDEADRIIETLLIKHAPKIGQRVTRIDETVLGNMGTFYRVNVEAYADAAEPERLCGALRADGYDCLVVTR